MVPLVFNLGCQVALFERIVRQLNAEPGKLELRSFPDGESYIRVLSDCVEQQAIILCGLDQPNPKLLPLLLLANTLRDLGATRIGLVTPYLAYMRQDIRFKDGEGITSRYFAALLSNHVDWLVTVDPHLHRFNDLGEIYSIPTRVAAAAPVLAEWISQTIDNPILIGPDCESEQWVAEVAALVKAPHLVLQKIRTGDCQVQVSIPDVAKFTDSVPVLIDDIVSTGHTFIETIKHLRTLDMLRPVCMAVHGVFAEGALAGLRKAGAANVVSCNTIAHPSNAMDVSGILASAARTLLDADS